VFLKPIGVKRGERLPAVLGLHDHGGRKYFGWRKIAQISPDIHPQIVEHRRDCYEGLAWANEVARRGYAVLVHDTFPFASRKVNIAEVSPEIAFGISEPRDDDSESISAYDQWAGNHETI